MDIHQDRPATASAAVSLVRCSVAAIGVSILQIALDHIGPGWTFTLLGALGVMTAPMLWLVWLWGMTWRIERADKLKNTSSQFVGSATNDVELGSQKGS